MALSEKDERCHDEISRWLRSRYGVEFDEMKIEHRYGFLPIVLPLWAGKSDFLHSENPPIPKTISFSS